MSYRNLAIDALSKITAYDPMMPQSDAMIAAWAEALERARIRDRRDVLEAVALMYERHGDPGWRPTPKILVATAREVRRDRMEREPQQAIGGPERITFSEFKARHPDVEFPKVGKSLTDADG